jgi:cytidylate kinase
MGITFEEVCELAEKDPKYDRLLDDTQVALAKESGIVLGSRLAVWLIEDASLKVYLSASPEVRAQRIANREHADFKVTYDDMMKRDKRDRERYIRLYQIDIDDYHFADLILDTDSIDQHEITDRIVEEVIRRISSSDATR